MLPTTIMPSWLIPVVKVNPVSYALDGVRQMLLGSGSSAAAAAGYNVLAPLWVDFGVLAAFAGILSILGIVLSWRFLSK
jgi:ABC-2 type transport system permease protein